MNWHYVNQGQQAGPVTEEQLLALLREGKISEDTLVWREGMPNWTPFRQAGIAAPAASIPPLVSPPPAASLNPNETVCAECGKIFPIDETIPYGNVRVCASCKPVFLQKLAEGAKINTGFTGLLEYGGFWIRVGAKLIDGLILGIPFMVVFIFLMVGTGAFTQNPGQWSAEPIAPFLTLFLQFGMIALQVGYQTFFVGKFGATPGKMVCKLKIVMSDGSPVSYGRAAGRAFAEMLSGMICYIGYLMVPFDAQKRALHDHICNTRVVQK
jgi:uncharacterized RDD family membrane protein YckC